MLLGLIFFYETTYVDYEDTNKTNLQFLHPLDEFS